MEENQSPPKLAYWLLKIFCRADYRDEVAGDLQEVYEWRLSSGKVRAARYRYFLDTLSAVRFYSGGKLISFITNAMIFSFIKSSFRNFKRHLGYTTLNILGLSFGLASALFILEYVSDELEYNSSSMADRLYRISNDYYRYGNLIYESSMTFSGVGPAMKQDLPEVIEFARLFSPSITWGGATVLTRPERPDISFKEQKLFFADPTYLRFFDLSITYGVNDLIKPNTVMLSEELAIKYFGNPQESIGKTLKYSDLRVNQELVVTGVFEKPDYKLQADPDILVSYATMELENPDFFVNDWGGNSFITFVEVTDQANPLDIEKAMSQITLHYKPEYLEKDDEGEYKRVNHYYLMRVSDIHLGSKFQNEVGPIGDSNTIQMLKIIALFIVLIAWVNFINLTTAKSVDRAREVGVRKVMGARKDELVIQFFIEAVLINIMSVLLAFTFVILCQPLFNLFIENDLSLQSIDLGRFGLTSIIFFLAGTALSGFYPALIISSHHPINALKGSFNINSGIFLRRVLIVFQLLFGSLLIMATIGINQQLRFMNNQNMGFDMEQVLILHGPVINENQDEKNIIHIKSFMHQVLSIPGVNQIGSTSVIPGQGILRGNVLSFKTDSENNPSIERVVTSNGFLTTLNVNFLAGKDFDNTMSGFVPIILNRSGAQLLGFSNPSEAIGQILYESTRYERRVVGVIDDYHHESLNRAIDPMYFVRSEQMDELFAIRLNTTQISATLDSIEEMYKAAYPGNPAEYYFLDEFFERQYKGDKVNRKVFGTFALMAIFVACLGLYGLSSFTTHQRTKEVGVRKVLGANVIGLFALMFKEVFLMVLLSFLIASPIAWLGIESWLNDFAYRTSIGPFLFVIPLILIILITLVASGSQILKVAYANPVDSLRYE